MRTEYIGPGSRPRNARLFERDRRHHYWRHPLSYLHVIPAQCASGWWSLCNRLQWATHACCVPHQCTQLSPNESCSCKKPGSETAVRKPTLTDSMVSEVSSLVSTDDFRGVKWMFCPVITNPILYFMCFNLPEIQVSKDHISMMLIACDNSKSDMVVACIGHSIIQDISSLRQKGAALYHIGFPEVKSVGNAAIAIRLGRQVSFWRPSRPLGRHACLVRLQTRCAAVSTISTDA